MKASSYSKSKAIIVWQHLAIKSKDFPEGYEPLNVRDHFYILSVYRSQIHLFYRRTNPSLNELCDAFAAD
ncbi:hypothetical protein Taro_047048 [Colocasia esculenta]|uniref:Uncharacterized protein n=1 Tax=Colocasia esculenta TaxID=4460 RepID=A0A843X3A4_COLES|nr:hypothetical protein [Colocasia esculenta]